MSSPNVTHETKPRKLRRANDAGGAGPIAAPRLLFDEFWREGEIAMLFGAAGAGKSLLAVGLAEALARGRPIEGLAMPAKPRRVLYVDLVLSGDQFAFRYSCDGVRNGRRRYKFSSRFYRDRPPEGERLVDWIRTTVTNEKTRVVIVDDLSVISRSDDGTRETLELVRELRRMTRELGISVLVLADSQPPVFDRSIAERDLRRTRVLCGYADSVFALSVETNADRHLVQTRTQGELVWTHRRPVRFVAVSRDNGFVELKYFEPALTTEERNLICNIRSLHDGGQSFRGLAAKLKMSKSTIARLYAKWRPEFEPDKQHREVAKTDETDETENEIDEYDDFIPDADRYGIPLLASGSGTCDAQTSRALPVHRIPFLGSLRRRSIYDLDLGYDARGNVIHIESLDEHTRKPIIWYTIDSKGDVTRHERQGFGIHLEKLGKTEYI